MKFIQGFIILSILLIGLSLTSYKVSELNKDKINIPYPEDFNSFLIEIDNLLSLTHHIDSTNTVLLEQQISSTRLAYKRIEFILDYYHTKHSALHINGGPIYKVDEDNPERDPTPPNGLQALDELIYSDEVIIEQELIDSLTHALKKDVVLVGTSNTPKEIEPGRLIETIKSGLVRVFTLGVTGFDTPGSGNAIAEAQVSMQSMLDYFKLLKSLIEERGEGNYNAIVATFEEGIGQLQNGTFDSFDRLHFLKACINPLYDQLGQFEEINGLNEIRYKNHGQDYSKRNLFDPGFLDSKYYQEFSYQPLNNPRSIRLGKTLFYDPILSKNLNMSCSSCHDPNKAFADGLPKSKTNVQDVFTQRNSPGLIDVTYSKRYFHDLRTSNLERQISHVFENEEEFNMSFRAVVDRLNESRKYRKMFSEAYGGIANVRVVNQRSISNALAAYVNSLVSFDSEFDKYVTNVSEEYPEEAKRGFNIFMGKGACGTCHFPPAFNGTVPPFYIDSESEVLGVTLGLDTLNPQLDPDLGRYSNGKRWERRPHFKHSFKTPGLRNVELTGPYMHNGSFNSLEEVMEFYNRGGGAGMGLNINNQTLSSDPLGLNKQEIDDVIAFLKTLTDTSGTHPGKVRLPLIDNNPAWNNR